MNVPPPFVNVRSWVEAPTVTAAKEVEEAVAPLETTDAVPDPEVLSVACRSNSIDSREISA